MSSIVFSGFFMSMCMFLWPTVGGILEEIKCPRFSPFFLNIFLCCVCRHPLYKKLKAGSLHFVGAVV